MFDQALADPHGFAAPSNNMEVKDIPSHNMHDLDELEDPVQESSASSAVDAKRRNVVLSKFLCNRFCQLLRGSGFSQSRSIFSFPS